jgi:hypothetical protein
MSWLIHHTVITTPAFCKSLRRTATLLWLDSTLTICCVAYTGERWKEQIWLPRVNTDFYSVCWATSLDTASVVPLGHLFHSVAYGTQTWWPAAQLLKLFKAHKQITHTYDAATFSKLPLNKDGIKHDVWTQSTLWNEETSFSYMYSLSHELYINNLSM